MKRRRWLYGVAALALLLVLADAALWLAAQRALARGFDRWAAAMAARGVVVTAGQARAGGFPTAATRSFALRLQAGDAALRSDRVVLRLSPTDPGTLRVDLPAPVGVSVPGLPPLALASADWRVTARLDGSGIVATDARGLRLAIAEAGGPPRDVQAALLHLQAQPVGEALNLVGSAQSIVLPAPLPGEAWPLGRHVASAAFELVAHGRLPQPTDAAGWLDRAALAAWRDSGGALDVRRLAVGYGPLGVSGGGHLALDAELQPTGQASFQLLGYAETLDALAAAHVVTAHAAQAAAAVLGLLARAPADGGAPEVPLGVSLRDRVLTAAGFPLLRLPMLTWPGGA